MPDTRYKELPDFYPDTMRQGPQRLTAQEAFMGSVLATNHKGHWLMRQQNGTWAKYEAQSAAKKAMVQHWGGAATSHHLNDKAIAAFMHDDMAPVVCGFMPVPTSQAPAIEFKGSTFINSWDATAITQPDAQAAADPALQDILWLTFRMFRENLCGRADTLSLQHMLDVAKGDDPAELEWRFFMNFLAKPYQQIGCNMQVNSWFLGAINGLGRGTLTTQIIPLIWGRSNVVELQALDVEKRGWTDSIVGALWVIINELKVDYQYASFWNSFIKANSCEGVLRITRRQNDAYDALNFANWIFTSNNEQPRCLDSKDRRNALIQCFANIDDEPRKAACDLALSVYNWINETTKTDPALVQRYAGALAHFLTSHPVNDKLLDFAPDTILKQDVTEATAQDLDGLDWLRNDDHYPRDQWLLATDYLDHFNRYERCNIHPRRMGGILSTLARYGLVEAEKKKKHPNKAGRYRVPLDMYPRSYDDEETKRRANEKVVSIAGMLPAPRRK